MRNAFAIAAALAVAACSQAPVATTVDGAWVRLPAVPGNPGAAYFTIHGGSAGATLVKVSAKFAVRTEMHETMAADHGSSSGAAGQMMTMTPVKDVSVPAGGTVKFAPGGKHVMLFDVTPDIHAGDKAPLTLGFADGKNVEVQAVVVGPGDPAPN